MLDKRIAEYGQAAKMNDNQMVNTIARMKEDAELLRQQILSGNDECNQAAGEFDHMQKTANKLAGHFNRAGFKNRVA